MKGISELIGAFLLIGIVVSIAAAFNGWVLPIIQSQSKSSSGKGEKIIDCSFANINIIESEYNCTSARLFLSVKNYGPRLGNFKAQITFQNKTIESYNLLPENVTLEKTEKEIFYINTNPDMEEVSVFSEDCPNIGSDTISRSKINFVGNC